MKLQGIASAPLVEPEPVRDIFITGVARVDTVGAGLYRVTYFADGKCTFDGRDERIVVARLVMTNETITTGRQFVIAEMAKHSLVPANG